jgi:hypothetical protein
MNNYKLSPLFLCALALVVLLSGCGSATTPASSALSSVAPAPATSLAQAKISEQPAATTTAPAATTSERPTTTVPVATTTVPPPTTSQWTPVNGTPLGDPPDTVLTVRILLADGNFDPKVVTVPIGAKVVWWTTEHWVDQTLKTDDGTVLGTPFLFKALEYTFTTPGTYNYYDDFSPWVKGTVIVY